ncbi:MAG: pilE [Burkholderia sp.]|jgi:type IV pilus assembly protein PilE|nr:pilE [Burkholderia sp.]
MRRHKSKPASLAGHTLIELLVVLGILAVLAAAAMQGWQDLVRRQQRAEGKAALLAVMQQQERHFSRHGRYQAFDASAPGHFKWHSGPTPADSAYAISAVACAGLSLGRCVTALAYPGGAGVRPGHGDPACGVLRLDSRGVQQADGGPACW